MEFRDVRVARRFYVFSLAGGAMATRRNRENPRRWSARVTRESDALDLQRGVFERDDPKSIARSLKRSAEHSERRKADPYRSAMSMLTFYINRAGRNLPRRRRDVLERAKDELRAAFHRPASRTSRAKA
jgi:hypothetical protein